MAPKFGTSGVRGLVTELTDQVVFDYVTAFLSQCDIGTAVYIGWDLRESSPHIAEVCREAAKRAGVDIVTCGVLPTPALAFAAQQAGAGAIMITGSHIPADRNGIKFYTVAGEISKQDESRIVGALGQRPVPSALADKTGHERDGTASANSQFKKRYTQAFAAVLLSGQRIGVYQHSSVARDLLVDILKALGAMPIPLERTQSFVPVDTEAVDETVRQKFAAWCSDHKLDALVSTDGDADRPMLADATGRIVPGDVLGALSARYLGAKVLCTPVSSNTMIAQMPDFEAIHLTQIGSPYVVAAIQEVLAQSPEVRVVGYEANGGFLLGYPHQTELGKIAPLMTRDCVLPIIATLAAAADAGQTVAAQVAALPKRFTFADRIAGIETEVSKAFIAELLQNPKARSAFFTCDSDEISLDDTDGLRVSFANQDVVHLRPSGNAPEFRCYAESHDPDRARALVATHLNRLKHRLM